MGIEVYGAGAIKSWLVDVEVLEGIKKGNLRANSHLFNTWVLLKKPLCKSVSIKYHFQPMATR